MKTIRQRKDDLIAAIRNNKTPPMIVAPITETIVTDTDAFKKTFLEYQQILISNGIKNEELITKQLRRMLTSGLSKSTIYSNLKFLNLLRSRLTEEGIPLKDAETIMMYVKFNMTDINEDDDFIGDIALEFAEVCKIHYDVLVTSDANWDIIGEKFNILPLQLPVA